MSQNNLIKDLEKILDEIGLTIEDENGAIQTPSSNYSLAKQIFKNKNVLVPFLIDAALRIKDGMEKFEYEMLDMRDKGILQQFLNNLQEKGLISNYSLPNEGKSYKIDFGHDNVKRRFFRSDWAEQCFRYAIMNVVQPFCSGRAKPLSHKVMQNVELKRKNEKNIFTELDLVVQIENLFYIFEVKSGPWIRILQWAKRENTFVYKDSPFRNVVCTVHDSIPPNIFEPQILWSLKDIQVKLLELLKRDFPE